jgi:hypothetical protein
VLEVSREKADELAFCTRGYSLAFQALGYHYWNAICRSDSKDKIDNQKVYEELDITLSELAYEKIWDELSASDKKVLKALNLLVKKNGEKSVKVDEIKKLVNMTSNTFNTYRARLLDSGVVDGKQYGYLSFKLPRFENFIDSRLE